MPGWGITCELPFDEFDDVGLVEDVLIESSEEENFVALEWAADGASELLLAIVRLERQEGIVRAEGTVAEIIESRAVQVIGAGLGDDVDDGAAGAALLGAVSGGGDAELLHDVGGDFVGGAIASARLGEESVVVVAAVDEEAVLESANAAEGEIAVGGGIEAARILRDAGREQGEVGEAAAVQGEIVQGALVEQRGDAVGLSVDQDGRCGDSHGFMWAGYGEVEIQRCGAANIHLQLGRDLRGHAFGGDAGGVIAGREQVESEAAFGVGGCGEAQAGRGADHDDGRLRNAAAGGIEDRAVESAGGVLGGEGGGE